MKSNDLGSESSSQRSELDKKFADESAGESDTAAISGESLSSSSVSRFSESAQNSQIASIAEKSLRGMDQISDRSVSLTRILGGIGWCMFTLVAIITMSSVMILGELYNLLTFSISGGLLLLSGLIAWWALIYPKWKFETTGWRLDETGFKIRSGIFWREIISVPRSRIQHADVHQGPLMRIYGLANLIIHTAGTENASVTIGGLRHDVAERIRDQLIQTEVQRPSSSEALVTASEVAVTEDQVSTDVSAPEATLTELDASNRESSEND